MSDRLDRLEAEGLAMHTPEFERQIEETLADLARGGPQDDLIAFLTRDNSAMRLAGCDLAEAALRVIRDYDGLHRLALAVAGWANALANEGGRDAAERRDKEASNATG